MSTFDASKILLIANTPFLPLLHHLKKMYQVETASSLHMAEFLIAEWEPDILITEDHSDFLNWVQRIRSSSDHSLGIIAVNQNAEAENEKFSLQVGCDHWIHQENFNAVIWRVQSLLSKMKQHTEGSTQGSLRDSSQIFQIKNLKIYMDSFLVKRLGEVVAISPTQFNLLAAFLKQQDQLLSRESLKKQVWMDSEISLRSIDAQISKLRKILPELDEQLINVYGKGYVFSQNQRQVA